MISFYVRTISHSNNAPPLQHAAAARSTKHEAGGGSPEPPLSAAQPCTNMTARRSSDTEFNSAMSAALPTKAPDMPNTRGGRRTAQPSINLKLRAAIYSLSLISRVIFILYVDLSYFRMAQPKAKASPGYSGHSTYINICCCCVCILRIRGETP